MNRVCPCLLLPLLAIAACKTERKPLIGFDEPPPGSFILGPWDEGNAVRVWPIFDLPNRDMFDKFRFRLNDQVVVYMTSDEGFYDYATAYLQGWTSNGFPSTLGGLPSDTYTVEMADSAGKIWGRAAPLLIASGGVNLNSTSSGPQLPTIVFTHFDAQIGSWNIDPTTQDSDPATDEITVTNLVNEDVVVERCLIAAGARSSCTLVGTVAPGADLLTVERVAAASAAAAKVPDDHQALFIHLASDAAQSYQRDLALGSVESPSFCQIERIIVHGRRAVWPDSPGSLTSFAMSSCYGNASDGTGYVP